MKAGKLEELLKNLQEKDVDIVLDTCKMCEEPKPEGLYDLVSISIECKDRTVVKLGFEERIDKCQSKVPCRMKNMGIELLNSISEGDEVNE